MVGGTVAATSSWVRRCGARATSCSVGTRYWPNVWGQSRQPRSRVHCRLQVSSAGQGATIAASAVSVPSQVLRRQVTSVTRSCQRAYAGSRPVATRQAVAANVTGAMSPHASAKSAADWPTALS